MKTVRFIAYLFYRYYSNGATKDIPYISTLCALVMLLGLHIFQFVVLFDKVDILPFSYQNNRAEKFFVTALCLAPVFVIVALLIKKTDIEAMHFEENKIRNGNIALVIYIITSVALLLFLILYKKGKL